MPCKILWAICEMDKGRTATYGPEDRKQIMMGKALHPIDDLDRLHVSRKKEGRELTSIKNCGDASLHKKEQSKTNYSN